MVQQLDLAEAEDALLALSPAQAIAAEALAGGATHAQAAAEAGVARETVTRWSSHHPAFAAAVNRNRTVIAAEHASQLRRLWEKALAAVEGAVDDGDTQAALAVLRLIGTAPMPVIGPTDPSDILDAEINRLRTSLPPEPRPRDSLGMPDPLAILMGPDPAERVHQITVERLTAITAGE